jgi:hypothetical protein
MKIINVALEDEMQKAREIVNLALMKEWKRE